MSDPIDCGGGRQSPAPDSFAAGRAVIVTNREIFDLVQKIDRKLGEHIATTDIRLRHLEARAGRPWQVWIAVLGSLVALPVSVWAAAMGVS